MDESFGLVSRGKHNLKNNSKNSSALPPSALQLFEAVASRDYDALTNLFVAQARHAVLSHLRYNSQYHHNGSSRRGNNSYGAPYHSVAEEKLDEVLAYPESPIAMSRYLGSIPPHSSAARPASPPSAYASFFQRSAANGNSFVQREQEHQDYAALLQELSNFLQDKQQKTNKTSSALPPVTPDMDRLLRDASSSFADSRPPSRFVVYHPDAMDSDPPGPPLFDGSVAQGTPPTLGTGGLGSPSGGTGTILHLCCVLDVPLALALLLSMGADARASHTVFRRLMIHEAACNGSIQCLTLLLELGQKYGDDLYEQANCKLPSRRLYSELDLPFLPRRLSNAIAEVHDRNASHESAMSPSAVSDGYGFYMPRSNFFTRPSPERSTATASSRQQPTQNFLEAITVFKKYSNMVQQGLITELDAARQVMERNTVSELCRASLVHSCVFSRFKQQTPSRFYGRPFAGDADGHGNTPLHWAAFKNEVQCVSLLLRYHADPDARAHPSGWTPLHDAAYSNSVESIDLLLQAGATVDSRANSGATPLCFAAQEDAAEAAALLLERGADLTMRCCAVGFGSPGDIGSNSTTAREDASVVAFNAGPMTPHNRFSGYTPLHYCAHYNAQHAARVLLKHPAAKVAMEMPDLSDRLPIHVAVARGSSDVLRELLHAGARVETRTINSNIATSNKSNINESTNCNTRRAARRSPTSVAALTPSTPIRRTRPPSPETTPRPRSNTQTGANNANSNSDALTPVSSPILRSMIPSQPVASSKPWNCLTQRAIDECRDLITQAEQNWTPNRHLLFTPADRRAVMELLRVGKRLELNNAGIFTDLWPLVLSFCGRGWFDDDRDSICGGNDNVAALTTTSSSALGSDSNFDRNEDDQLSLPTF